LLEKCLDVVTLAADKPDRLVIERRERKTRECESVCVCVCVCARAHLRCLRLERVERLHRSEVRNVRDLGNVDRVRVRASKSRGCGRDGVRVGRKNVEGDMWRREHGQEKDVVHQ